MITYGKPLQFNMWRMPTQYEIDIFHIACEYMAKTELYDRSLIHKMYNGSAWVHPRYRQLSNLYAIKLRKELIKNNCFDWNDVIECIKQHDDKTDDWWIEQWEMWQELEEENKIISVEIREN